MDGYILIVDDDSDIRNMIGIYLENEGLPFIKCKSAGEALQILQEYKVDLILLDVMMPGLDGISACMQIRKENRMPIIFMSAKVEDIDIVAGLMAGGDDYITKPFNPVQLLARIRAQLRRYKQYSGAETPGVFHQGELSIDTRSRQVWFHGKEVHLTPKEYSILDLLMRNKGQVLSVATIYEKVWNEEFFQNENTVMMHIANLRNKLSETGFDEECIKTIWGQGYKL